MYGTQYRPCSNMGSKSFTQGQFWNQHLGDLLGTYLLRYYVY